MKTKILLTRSMLRQDIDYITDGLNQSIRDQYELIIPEDYKEDTLILYIEDADIILGPYITERMIQKGKRVKLMQVPWTGLDTVNFDALKDTDIILCNSHSNSTSVAELGLALTLDLMKKITYHNNQLKEGNWNRENTPLSLKSRTFSKEKIIILGCGHIGTKLAVMFSSLGAEVIGFHEKEDIVNKSISILNMNKLGDYLPYASIIVSALPLTKETEGFINRTLIDQLSKECFILNLSRAEIVSENDIYEALKNERIAGFASDVWWNTPKRGESVSHVSQKYNFSTFPNVIMSPHRAGFIEGELPHLDDAIRNIINFVKGEELINIVR